MARSIGLGLVGLILLGFGTTSVKAQETLLGELYGRGVHAYFAGEYVQAYDQLTTAIKQGSKDPRCYYFRGLVYMKLGRPEQAKQDFTKGASLEIHNEQIHHVGRALERVQGVAREQLERVRQQTRIAAYKREVRRDKRQRAAITHKVDDRRVLRQPAPPEGSFTEDVDASGDAEATPEAPKPKTGLEDDLFNDDKPEAPATPAATPKKEDDLFKGVDEPTAKPKADDFGDALFDEPKSGDKPKKAAAPATPPQKDDPFEDIDKPATTPKKGDLGDDLFNEPKKDKVPPKAAPAAKTPASPVEANIDDMFGPEEDAPAPKKAPATKKVDATKSAPAKSAPAKPETKKDDLDIDNLFGEGREPSSVKAAPRHGDKKVNPFEDDKLSDAKDIFG